MEADLDIIDAEIIERAKPDEDIPYEIIVKRLNEQFPAISPKEIDFSRLKGSKRIAKAIILHLCTQVGWPPHDVAAAIQEPVDSVLDLLYQAIQENVSAWDIESLRSFETLKLDAWERKAIVGLQRSFEDEETETVTETEDGYVTKTTRKGQSGNPAWARILLEIQKRRAALTGMDKPTKVQVDKNVRQVKISIVEVKDRQQVEAAKNAGLLK